MVKLIILAKYSFYTTLIYSFHPLIILKLVNYTFQILRTILFVLVKRNMKTVVFQDLK